MARRASYINHQPISHEHSLILDSGDFIGGAAEKQKLTAEYVLKAFARMKYDAINLGEQDFLPGVNFLLDMKNKYDLPFISANVFESDSNTTVFPPFIIKAMKEFRCDDTVIPALRVGIFGVMMFQSKLITQKDDPQLVVKDPIETSKTVVAQLKKQCDIIIGLVHIPNILQGNYIRQVPGIDIIIAGHDATVNLQPQKIENTIVLLGGNEGQYVGDLGLMVNSRREIMDYKGKLVLLDKDIKDDPDMAKVVEEYKAKELLLRPKSTVKVLGM